MSRTPTRPREFEARNRRFEAAFRHALNAIIVIDEKGTVVEVNPSALEMFGYAPGELIGENVTMLMPEKYRAMHSLSLSRHVQTGQISVMGKRVRLHGLRKDGEVFPVELEVHSANLDTHREFVGVLRDVTDREDAERELHHRMGNLFAVILGAIGMIETSAHTPTDFREKLESHIQALSSVYNLLQTHHLRSMPLKELLEAVTHPYVPEGNQERIRLQGENIDLQPTAATTLGLIVNELATNSTKHGALSTTQGQVIVEWERSQIEKQTVLRLFWQDSSIRRVEEPRRRGFGTLFIERAVKGLRGAVTFSYPPEGMRCTIEIPLAP